MKLVRAVLKKLRDAQLYAKLSKCEFHHSKIDYLGCCISHEGIEMDPEKVQAVWSGHLLHPEATSKLPGICELLPPIHPIFFPGSLPITNLKIKGEGKPKLLKWTTECQVAFKKLKCLFAAEPKHHV